MPPPPGDLRGIAPLLERASALAVQTPHLRAPGLDVPCVGNPIGPSDKQTTRQKVVSDLLTKRQGRLSCGRLLRPGSPTGHFQSVRKFAIVFQGEGEGEGGESVKRGIIRAILRQ